MKMTGNTVLITGGATGIGFAMAKNLLERDNTVIISGRRVDRLEYAKEQLPGLKTARCDVAMRDSRAALHAYIEMQYPEINILINNAVMQRQLDFSQSIKDFVTFCDDEIAVNFAAPIFMSALFAQILSHKENAAVVHMSSSIVYTPDYADNLPIFSATKAGLHAFSVVQRKMMEPLGIRVVEIVPPVVGNELGMDVDDFVQKAFAKMEADEEEIWAI